MKEQKKTSAFSVLMEYAGRHKILTYTSLFLSSVTGVLALMPFVYLWRIIKEVIEVSPDFSRATNITHYSWMAVLFSVIFMLVYFGALMSSHLSAFRVAAKRRSIMHYIRGTKKWRRKVVSLLLIGSLIVGVSQTDVKISAHSDEERTYEDGVYIGSGTGFKLGTTTVKVTVKDDKIVSVEEVSTEDTKSYFQRAKVIMNQIVEKNSLDVPSSEEILSQIGVREQKLKLWEVKNNKIVHGEKYFDDVTINTKIFAKGDGTKENPFVISNDAQLQNFAKTVDDGKSYKDQFIVLNNDINLEKKNGTLLVQKTKQELTADFLPDILMEKDIVLQI